MGIHDAVKVHRMEFRKEIVKPRNASVLRFYLSAEETYVRSNILEQRGAKRH